MCRNLSAQFQVFKFNLDIFVQLGFFTNNVVLIGANGSGKTTLANKLKKTINPNNGIVISAQRVLKISKYIVIDNFFHMGQELKQSWTRDKTYKNLNEYGYLDNEFDTVLKTLIADNAAKGLKYANQSKGAIPQTSAPQTNLDSTIEIWNSLIAHRELIIAEDQINIVPKIKNGSMYELVQMSEGEKVMLYLVAQVLQAPENGFIIIDEPEIFLHRSILRKLWDILELRRKDCIFIYLTHDIGFAISRNTAKKVWIRSYQPTENWQFEAVKYDELPEELLLELLGSQKKILFCEGDAGGDEKVYNLIFPNFTIKPVGSCKNVIDYVRAFNKIHNRLSNAYGIIDADFRVQEELNCLKEDKIFNIKLAEIENLIFDEEFLNLCAIRFNCNNGQVDQIKNGVLTRFEQDLEMQVAHYVNSHINHIFNNSHIPKANMIADLEKEFDLFVKQIDIKKMTEERTKLIQKIIASKDYTEMIKYYNNKGLISIIEQVFGHKSFRQFAIIELKNNSQVQEIFRKYFPAELTQEHNLQ